MTAVRSRIQSVHALIPTSRDIERGKDESLY
jgi:hypothetical protein